jgi:hypothetical protein
MSVTQLLFAIVILYAMFSQARARVVVQLSGGDARCVRGTLPPGLLEDLRVVASLAPGVRGRVEIRGHGSALHVRTPGLPEGVSQQARNVVHLRRNRL